MGSKLKSELKFRCETLALNFLQNPFANSKDIAKLRKI